MKKYCLKFIIISFLTFSFVSHLDSQPVVDTSLFNPYKVNYWVTVPIIVVGLTTNYIGIPKILHKDNLTSLELQSLNKDILNSFDGWALNQNPEQKDKFAKYSDYTLSGIVVLPLFLFIDKQIRQDWVDILMMYMETISITSNIYEWSFLGPTFINRVRPLAYYSQLTDAQRKSGNNRNSFYSGHVASAAAATFFMAKVYNDYNPELGSNKYFTYAAAAVPPLILGYLRVKSLQHFPSDVMVGMGVGALCGILIPEFHRLNVKDVSMGLFTTPETTGIALQWQTDFLK